MELIQHHVMPVVLGKPVEYFLLKNVMDIWKTCKTYTCGVHAQT